MHGSPLTRIRRFQREIFGECPECLLIMDEILKTYKGAPYKCGSVSLKTLVVLLIPTSADA